MVTKDNRGVEQVLKGFIGESTDEKEPKDTPIPGSQIKPDKKSKEKYDDDDSREDDSEEDDSEEDGEEPDGSDDVGSDDDPEEKDEFESDVDEFRNEDQFIRYAKDGVVQLERCAKKLSELKKLLESGEALKAKKLMLKVSSLANIGLSKFNKAHIS